MHGSGDRIPITCADLDVLAQQLTYLLPYLYPYWLICLYQQYGYSRLSLHK
jgi:hypothetical protein